VREHGCDHGCIVHNGGWFEMGDMNMRQAMAGKGRWPETGAPPVPVAASAVLTRDSRGADSQYLLVLMRANAYCGKTE